jgi:hypothetical protein
MMTLISTFLSFGAGGLPKILDMFQDRGDKKHELAMMAMQRERELALAKEGFVAQMQVEEIKTEQIAMQTQTQERMAMYRHDMKIGDGASTWVVNLRASVRPVVTYLFVALLIVIDIASVWYAYTTGVEFIVAMEMAFSDDEMQILASIIAFWFGTQAFSKK